MSVLIYGIDNEAKDFRTLTVSSEACFRNSWEPAINQLQLMYIGDQRWLYRKDIDKILAEFKVLLDFSKDKAELENITINQCPDNNRQLKRVLGGIGAKC